MTVLGLAPGFTIFYYIKHTVNNFDQFVQCYQTSIINRNLTVNEVLGVPFLIHLLLFNFILLDESLSY